MTTIRRAEEDDHPAVVEAISSWWPDSRGPAVSAVVPRLFPQHFASTCFVAEDGDRMVGFLIGFLSADQPQVGYLHFVGVDPAQRRNGLARRLYDEFFEAISFAGRTEVHAITSPENTGSIEFHRRLGFRVLDGDGEIEGIPVLCNYDGRGGARVRFALELG